MIKKILLWGGVAFLLLFIAYHPTDAADVVRQLLALPRRWFE